MDGALVEVIGYLDEASRTKTGGLLYVVGAAVIIDGDADRARGELRKLLLPRQKYLHWANERDARRRLIIDAVSEIGTLVIAASYFPTTNRRQEAARRDCLTNVAADLCKEGAKELVMETRGEVQDRKDNQTLLDAGHAGLTPDLRYRHQGKLEEPLLWAADAVVGAITAHLSGAGSEHFARLDARLLKLRQL